MSKSNITLFSEKVLPQFQLTFTRTDRDDFWVVTQEAIEVRYFLCSLFHLPTKKHLPPFYVAVRECEAPPLLEVLEDLFTEVLELSQLTNWQAWAIVSTQRVRFSNKAFAYLAYQIDMTKLERLREMLGDLFFELLSYKRYERTSVVEFLNMRQFEVL